LHVDTGHNFPETIEFRDRLVKELGLELIVRNVQDAIDEGKVVKKLENIQVETVSNYNTLDAIEEFKLMHWWCCRDEEKARAKERIFSVRDDFGQWDEKTNVQNYLIY
jgi:sulfate adenylyltransferase subunit 2